MGGYRARQAIFVLVGLALGWVSGGLVAHYLAKTEAERAVKESYGARLTSTDPEYRAKVEENIAIIQRNASQDTTGNWIEYIILYGITSAVGGLVGFLMAGASKRKVVAEDRPDSAGTGV